MMSTSTIIGTGLVSGRERKHLETDVETGNLGTRDLQGIVTDKQGRRRFHGAFQGGFSAGYFNTVGSAEGWKPSQFKSSRKDGTRGVIQQSIHDFMDEDDDPGMGQRMSVTEQFQFNAAGHSDRNQHGLVVPVEKSVGRTLLRRLGWREGQGVGPRIRAPISGRVLDDGKVDPHAAGFKFAPKDVAITAPKPKIGTHGLGYLVQAMSLGSGRSSSSNIQGTGVFNPGGSTAASRLKLRDEDDEESELFGNDGGIRNRSKYSLYLEDDASHYDGEMNEIVLRGHQTQRGMRGKSNVLKDKSIPFVQRYKAASVRGTCSWQDIRQEVIAIPDDFIPSPELEEYNSNQTTSSRQQIPLSVHERGRKLGEVPKPVTIPTKGEHLNQVLDVFGGRDHLSSKFSRATTCTTLPKQTIQEAEKKVFKVQLKVTKSEQEWYPVGILCKRLGLPKPKPQQQLRNELPQQFGQQSAANVMQPVRNQIPQDIPKGDIPVSIQPEEFERPQLSLFDSIFNTGFSEDSSSSESEVEVSSQNNIDKEPNTLNSDAELKASSNQELFDKFTASKLLVASHRSETNSMDPSQLSSSVPKKTLGPARAPDNLTSTPGSSDVAVTFPSNVSVGAINPDLPAWVTQALGQTPQSHNSKKPSGSSKPRSRDLNLSRGRRRRSESRSRKRHRSSSKHRHRHKSHKHSKKPKKAKGSRKRSRDRRNR